MYLLLTLTFAEDIAVGVVACIVHMVSKKNDRNDTIKLEGINTQGLYFVTITSEGEKYIREFMYLGY